MGCTKKPALFPHDFEVMERCYKSYSPKSHKYTDHCRRLVGSGYLEETSTNQFTLTEKGNNRLIRWMEKGN